MKRYTPDFPEMMRLCETNFAQLRRLLPRVDEAGETVNYQVANAQYRLTIVESKVSRSFASKRGMIIQIKSCINATKSIKLISFWPIGLDSV